ncbi:bifunctional 2-polyprenyl-6-hydroxyphenol methylase/3-demethylubiquinol 3-O-methyltransferase UbiG [Halovivax sp.]|uniref:class I SAM-dependent methyltransferase n=1 Tax=Halovivax sp. TaxID=1935978 RepID=UPI0025BE5BF3|nr:class I SAM-dependent methyltransferase [Halovivax sp.]
MGDFVEENRAYWEEAAAHHPTTDYYDVEAFLDGESSLWPLEREEVGDVEGKRLCHLQCHFGLDTLSWAREGAAAVTGVDFAAEAIELARELAAEAGLADRTRFVRTNVYDLPEILDERYDVVFTSYGVLGWLPDLDRWADVVSHVLEPGGTFYIAEIHPTSSMLPWDFDGETATFSYPYVTRDEPLTFDDGATYADEEADLEHARTHNWNHGLGEILTALLDAGLELDFVREHRFTTWEQFPDAMARGDDGYWRLDGDVDLPLLFSVRARKRA